jgi:hypothetical protein
MERLVSGEVGEVQTGQFKIFELTLFVKLILDALPDNPG